MMGVSGVVFGAASERSRSRVYFWREMPAKRWVYADRPFSPFDMVSVTLLVLSAFLAVSAACPANSVLTIYDYFGDSVCACNIGYVAYGSEVTIDVLSYGAEFKSIFFDPYYCSSCTCGMIITISLIIS